MFKRWFLLTVLFLFNLNILFSQLPVGEWREHFPYSKGEKIAVADNIIYCATELGLFYYNKSDNSINKISKANGLNDVGISSIKFSEQEKILIVGYSNGNLDIIDENKNAYNISDIKRKQIIGSKSINNICNINNLSYLACGFGVIVLDADKKEIKETYFIGDNGSQSEVFDITFDGNNIYCCTGTGIYFADINNTNLIDYNNWNKFTNIPNYDKEFNSIEYFAEKLFVNYDDENNNDTLYYYDGISWHCFDTVIHDIKQLNSSNEQLLFIRNYKVDVYNNDLDNIMTIYKYPESSPRTNDAAFDDEGTLWIADNLEGLVQVTKSWQFYLFYPNGPYKYNVSDIAIVNNKIWIAGGSKSSPWDDIGAYSFNNEKWENYNYKVIPEVYDIRNISKIIIDPQNSNHVYGGSWGYGLIEFNNGQFIKIYDEQNTILQNIIPYEHGYIRISSLVFDDDNNLWMSTSLGPQPIYVKKADGNWLNYEFENLIDGLDLGDMIITQNDHKWLIVEGRGLFVFDINNTLDDFGDDNYKKFDVRDENGKIINNDILSIAEDKEGIIWLGTTEGIIVYYSPENVFSGTNFYAQRPIIEVNNDFQYLLETKSITSITIDGADRKWFGTSDGGVFLMAEDGQKQILNYNIDNSPLPSNTINCITVNDKTGEVFIGTEKGIVSYQSTATEGDEYFNNVLVYPNPVRENYKGLITIKGLVSNVDVKITDISGNLVYQTRANGGTAIWNGKSFSGKKVHTGIYLIFCTNDDGSKTYVTKLLFVN
ncbi:MAG: T9SS type A sorting domain-containing protein [Bacteroidales bacterium]|nr:T9SS type A sorting domain-containing protein [Bacteroidales bacterium]